MSVRACLWHEAAARCVRVQLKSAPVFHLALRVSMLAGAQSLGRAEDCAPSHCGIIVPAACLLSNCCRRRRRLDALAGARNRQGGQLNWRATLSPAAELGSIWRAQVRRRPLMDPIWAELLVLSPCSCRSCRRQQASKPASQPASRSVDQSPFGPLASD